MDNLEPHHINANIGSENLCLDMLIWACCVSQNNEKLSHSVTRRN